jgi:hypothetical protein
MKRTILLSLLLILLLFPSAAYAQTGIVYGAAVPAGVTIDRDVLLIGPDVRIDGTVNGNAFILGNQVILDGKVDGSVALLGQNVSLGGTVTGAVYAMALTLDMPAAASLTRDLYALTVSLTSQPSSRIGRHLYALGLDAGLNGTVGGTLQTAIGPIQIYNGFMHLLGFDELMIRLHFDLPSATPPSSNVFGPKVLLRPLTQATAAVFDWANWAIKQLRSWALLFVLGLLALWLAPRTLQASGTPLRARPWRTLAVGFLVLIVSLNVFVLGLLLIALLFAVGLGLNAIGLWPISLALWFLSYSAIAVALTLLWLMIVFGTKVLVSYHLLSWLTARLGTARTLWLDLGALFVGTLLYTLLRAIPYVGWVFGVIVIAWGMGSAWLAYRESRQPATAHVDALADFPKTSSRAHPSRR